MTPEEVVQKQLETYNKRDIDGFISVIDENITIHNFSTVGRKRHQPYTIVFGLILKSFAL